MEVWKCGGGGWRVKQSRQSDPKTFTTQKTATYIVSLGGEKPEVLHNNIDLER